MEKKFARKRYFINPRFQTKFLISFITAMLLVLFFVVGITFLATRSVVSTTLHTMGEEIENITGLSHRSSTCYPSTWIRNHGF